MGAEVGQSEEEDIDLDIPDLSASIAQDSISQLLEKKRESENRIAQVLNSLKTEIVSLRELLETERATTSALRKEISGLQITSEMHVQKNKNLFQGYLALLRMTDNSGLDLSIEQKMEAILLASDTSVYLGLEPDLTTKNARNFLNSRS